MVAELARRIGGDHVPVVQLMGEGVDPHTYQASPGDVNQLNSAGLILYNGLHLEGKMGDLFAQLARKRPTLAVAESLPKEELLPGEQGHFDPHVWFDVALWAQTVPAVRDALSEFDPEHAADFERNASAYIKELELLHREVKEQLATIPKERRVLVTAHDAFRYFGRAYAIEVEGVQGVSTNDEASVKRVGELVDFLTRRQIKAVFVESSVSPRNLEALREGCRARGHNVAIGGELFSDALGAAGTPEGTYVGMVRHNVATIVQALR